MSDTDGVHLDDEHERRELEQRVEADVALDAEPAEPEEQVGLRAELRRVARDGEVAGRRGCAPMPLLRTSTDTRRGLGKGSGGGANDGWKPPTVSTKFGSVALGDEQAHLAVDGHGQHAGVEQRGEEVDPLLVEFDARRRS